MIKRCTFPINIKSEAHGMDENIMKKNQVDIVTEGDSAT